MLRRAKLWEADSGKLLRTLEGHVGRVGSVCFAPAGQYLVAAGDAGRLQFWDWDRGETFLYLYAFGPGAWLALLPDGRFDATPDALRWLCYTQRDTPASFTAEELLHHFTTPPPSKKSSPATTCPRTVDLFNRNAIGVRGRHIFRHVRPRRQESPRPVERPGGDPRVVRSGRWIIVADRSAIRTN